MTLQFPLFSQVVLVEDLPIYGLKRGAIAGKESDREESEID